MKLDLNNHLQLYKKEIVLPDIEPIVYLMDSKICIYDKKDIYVDNEIIDSFWRNSKVYKNIFLPCTFTVCSVDRTFCPYIVDDEDNVNVLLLYRMKPQFSFFSVERKNEYSVADCIGLLRKIGDKYFIEYYGGKRILKKIIKCNNSAYGYKAQMFLNIIGLNIEQSIDNDINSSLNNILKNIPIKKNKQKKDFDFLNCKLYGYQKNDIEWMSNIKNQIDLNTNNIVINYTDFSQVILDNKKFVFYKNTILPNINVDDIVYSNAIIKYYGGNIISEVGVGKTLIMLTYLMKHSENSYNKYMMFENELCNYFYKRGVNKGECCKKIKNKQNSLYCTEHRKTLFIDKRRVKLNKQLVNNDFSLRDYVINIEDTFYFKSNANLILCPNQLADQWVREYYEKFKQDDINSKRILLIITIDQYKNLTLADVLFADIIVVSYNFLSNINYKNIRRHSLIKLLDDIDKNENITSIYDIMNNCNCELNILNNFYYNTVILDEYHEISLNLFESIYLFKSTYKWNISATPFALGKTSFLNGIKHITSIDTTKNYLNSVVKKIDILYRRNTKDSIKNEYTDSILSDTPLLLDFTEQERRIYDAHSQITNTSDFLIKLCCDTSINSDIKLLIKNCKTLGEIEKVVLNLNKTKLCNIKAEIATTQYDIDDYSKIINKAQEQHFYTQYKYFETLDDVKIELSTCRRRLTILKKKYSDISRTYTYLKNAIENIKVVDTCPICLDDIPNDSISITKCGHKFCKECITEYITEICSSSTNTKCPKCNVEIKLADIYLLEDDPVKAPKIIDEDLNQLVQRIKSTKIGNIIHYIKNNFKDGDKCIIFSQWNEILVKVANNLTTENIKSVFCTGTVYQRKKSINSFQNDPEMNIICLSSSNSASGINLTSANKILFIEPVYGTKEYRTDIENQAVGRSRRIGGRSNIEIIRFIIKDSIEEDIYNNDNDNETDKVLINTENILLNGNVLEI